MVEVYINRTKIDIEDTDIKYVKQVNDLADVTTVNASYSYSLTVKKTPKNTATFQGLGLVGDTSTIPYTKNITQVIDNGSMIIPNGVSYVKKTGKDYKLVIQDGIIDFFRTIENKTLGTELDLSELDHSKTAPNIISSFTNPYYRYLISEYNGWTIKDNSINPDYQIPSINLQYLFDKIMEYSGYTYEGMPIINDTWITYATPPAVPTGEDVLVFQGNHFGVFNTIEYPEPNTSQQWENVYKPTWNSTPVYDMDFITLVNNWKLKSLTSNNYKAIYTISGTMTYKIMEGNIRYLLDMPLKFALYRDNVSLSSSYTTEETSFSISAGQIIELRPRTLTSSEAREAGITDERFIQALANGNYWVTKVTADSVDLELSQQGFEIFDFGEAMKDLSMTDFVKEVMFRKSLTPFPDANEKHIVFKTLSQRLDTSDYIDWSDKFVRRVDEIYEFGDYAIANNLLMKHDNNEETLGNGSLFVKNLNLKDNKTLFQSNYFAPPGNLVLLRGALAEFFYLIKFWDREIKDDEGTQTIQYKPITNHFFLLKEQTVNKTLVIGGLTVESFPKAIITGTMLTDVVSEFYSDWHRIFDGLRIHSIELKIGSYELSTLVMDKPYYFSDEASMYLLNKLSYESGKTATGEFLKIKT